MVRLPDVWQDPLRLARRMDRFVDELFRDWPFEMGTAFGRTDVYTKDGELVYEVELPGVKRQDIRIKVEDGQLILSGEVKREEKIEEENYLRMGRRYGAFRRSYPLPEEIDDPKRIKAQLRDGVLTVRIPLKKAVKEREGVIEIQVE